MNGCQASLAVIACASSDKFDATGAFAALEPTMASVGWQAYCEDFVAPMVSRWQPRGVVWDMAGGKELNAKGEKVFPLSRFGHLEAINPKLSFEAFLGACDWLSQAVDLKEQILYTGGPMSGAKALYPALLDSFGEWVAGEVMCDTFFTLLSCGRFTGCVLDAVADVPEDSDVGRLLLKVIRKGAFQLSVEGPPYRSVAEWMQREKVGAWQTTQAYRAQAAHAAELAGRRGGERPGDLFLTEVKGPKFMSFNGTCPFVEREAGATCALWWAEWIRFCTAKKIVPCWSFLGNDRLCKIAEQTEMVGASAVAGWPKKPGEPAAGQVGKGGAA